MEEKKYSQKKDTKIDIRREMLTKRLAISEECIKNKSKRIYDKIISSNLYRESNVVALYYPIKNEVNLLELISKNYYKKIFLLPKVVKGSKILTFYQIESLDSLEKGNFGILEPKTTLKRVEIYNIDLFLVPGIAFSRDGFRIGYGGGYYDTTLKLRDRRSVTVGVSFGFQLVDKVVDINKYDERMDYIVTESEFINCK